MFWRSGKFWRSVLYPGTSTRVLYSTVPGTVQYYTGTVLYMYSTVIQLMCRYIVVYQLIYSCISEQIYIVVYQLNDCTDVYSVSHM